MNELSKIQNRLLKCYQEHLICKDCLFNYIRIKISEGIVQDIGCPCNSLHSNNCQNIFIED